MKVLVLSNGNLEEKEINNTLEDLQKIVGGYIEIPYISETFAENGVDMIINEEGKFIEGLNAEIAVVSEKTQEILDIVYGNCIFTSHDDEGNTVELNDKQVKIVQEELNNIVGLMNRKTLEITELRMLFI